MPILGEKIKQLRLDRNWRQDDLSQKIGIHQRNISKYETGKLIPSKQTLEKFAQAFNIDAQELLKGTHLVNNQESLEQEFLFRFREIKKLQQKDQEFLIKLIDTVILKNQLQEVIHVPMAK